MGKKGMEKLPFLQAIYLQCGCQKGPDGPIRFTGYKMLEFLFESMVQRMNAGLATERLQV